MSENSFCVVAMVTVYLLSSISPLKFCCDFRPYFTIHDSEFREYTTRTQAPWVHTWTAHTWGPSHLLWQIVSLIEICLIHVICLCYRVPKTLFGGSWTYLSFWKMFLQFSLTGPQVTTEVMPSSPVTTKQQLWDLSVNYDCVKTENQMSLLKSEVVEILVSDQWDFTKLKVTSVSVRPNVILGVTNPFFIKTFQTWPHIVRLGEIKMAGRKQHLSLSSCSSSSSLY